MILCSQLPLLVLRFLSDLFIENKTYTLTQQGGHKLSLIIVKDTETPFGQLSVVKRFMKGASEKRPALLRYQTNYTVSMVH